MTDEDALITVIAALMCSLAFVAVTVIAMHVFGGM